MAGTAGIRGRGRKASRTSRSSWNLESAGAGPRTTLALGGVAVCVVTPCTCISAIYINVWVLGSPRADTRETCARHTISLATTVHIERERESLCVSLAVTH